MAASRITFDIYDYPNGNHRGSWVFDLEVDPSKPYVASPSQSFDIQMPTGSFWPHIRVYNENVSDEPTAQYIPGWYDSNTFTVTLEGPNEFSWTVMPNNINRISPDDLYYTTTPSYFLNQHGEAWFVFDGRTASIDVLCDTISGDADLYVFEPSDLSLLADSTESGISQDLVELNPGTDTHHDYYIGVFGFAAGTEFTLNIGEESAGGTIEFH